MRGETPAQIAGATGCLSEQVSNPPYATRSEVHVFGTVSSARRRPGATRADLIPIRKDACWLPIAQDELRAIFESTSHRTPIEIGYLPTNDPARGLGEPFDLLTFLDFVPEHDAAFNAFFACLTAMPERAQVEREVDIPSAHER